MTEGTRRSVGSLYAEGWTIDEIRAARRFWPTEHLSNLRLAILLPPGATRESLAEMQKAADFLDAAHASRGSHVD